jgi:hypothetical protein
VSQTGADRADSRSPDWFGYAVAGVIGIELSYGGENDDAGLAKIKNMLKTWIKNGVIKVATQYDQQQRKDKQIILPGDWNDGETHVTAADDDDCPIY